MSAQHTPGPWITTVRIQDKVHVLHGQMGPGVASRTIARVTVRDSWRTEQEANARLIAAAPELLKELEHAVRWFDQLNPADIARYRAVIAKATGSAA
jgi:hypothetical protein